MLSNIPLELIIGMVLLMVLSCYVNVLWIPWTSSFR